MTELNDELLVAYADGQLAKDQSKAVERVLEEDLIAAQRVDALRAANAHLETQFEAMLAGEPVPGVDMDISTIPVKKQRARNLLGRAVLYSWVGLGCLLGGTAAGYILHDAILPKPVKFVQLPAPPPLPAPDPIIIRITPPPANWQDDAARSFALLSRDSFAPGLDAQSNPDLVAFQLGKALGADFAIPDLSSAGLTFERGQVLQRDGVPLAQISYLPGSGAPVVFFALASKAQYQSLTVKKIKGKTVAVWGRENLSFLLAGNLPELQLRSLAETIQVQRALAAQVEAPLAPAASQEPEVIQSTLETETPGTQN